MSRILEKLACVLIFEQARIMGPLRISTEIGADPRALVKAVLKEMREPTDAMIAAAMAPYTHEIDDKMRAAFRATIVGYWQAMIDEVLK